MKTSFLCSFAFVVVGLFPACASDPATPAAACGAGTVAQNGTCVAVQTCGMGTVRVNGVCVAGTGGAGGATGAGGANAGGGAGATSTGGTSATGGAGMGTGGASMVGMGGTSPGAGGANGGGAGGSPATGGATGAAGWGAPGPDDDPCPTQLDFNCSTSCGPMSDKCATSTCHDIAVADDPLIIPTKAGTKFVIRMPSHVTDPACAALCGAGAPAYALRAKLATSPQPYPIGKFTTPAPWASDIQGLTSTPYCKTTFFPTCKVTTAISDGPMLFATSDPSAPARNIVLEFTTNVGSCP